MSTIDHRTWGLRRDETFKQGLGQVDSWCAFQRFHPLSFTSSQTICKRLIKHVSFIASSRTDSWSWFVWRRKRTVKNSSSLYTSNIGLIMSPQVTLIFYTHEPKTRVDLLISTSKENSRYSGAKFHIIILVIGSYQCRWGRKGRGLKDGLHIVPF